MEINAVKMGRALIDEAIRFCFKRSDTFGKTNGIIADKCIEGYFCQDDYDKGNALEHQE